VRSSSAAPPPVRYFQCGFAAGCTSFAAAPPPVRFFQCGFAAGCEARLRLAGSIKKGKGACISAQVIDSADS
jgi:hypothetical protein